MTTDYKKIYADMCRKQAQQLMEETSQDAANKGAEEESEELQEAIKHWSKDLYNFWSSMGVAHTFLDEYMDDLNADKKADAYQKSVEVKRNLDEMKKLWNKVYKELETFQKNYDE